MNKYKVKRKVINKIFKTERCCGLFVKKITDTDGQQLTRIIYKRQSDINHYVIDLKYTKGDFYALLGRCCDLDEHTQVDFLFEYHDLTDIILDIEDVESVFTTQKNVLKTDDFRLCGAKFISLDSYDNRQFFLHQLACLSPISFIKVLLFDK